ncbi:MAG: ABC transporter ATP-binding protein [Synergistaceae bacterium]|nr:ABC transporter ATP-binding protein [Synergistaceae bacterium]
MNVASGGGESNGNIIEVRDLSVSFKTYGTVSKVLSGVNLTVPMGGRIGLVGESGCGKTTTLKAILNILPSNAMVEGGEILYEGRNVFRMNEPGLLAFRQKGAGMIFQDPSQALNPVFSIRTQFLTALKYAKPGMSDKERLEIAKNALTDVSLADPDRILASYPYQLSGGMKQRVCIAMTISAGRRLLLADEPGTALDVTIQDQILRLLSKLVDECRLSIVMVSHSLGVVREVTNFVNIMYAGGIVESGGTNEVFKSPRHPYTAALMACLPKLTGTGIAEGIPGRIPDYANPPPGCRFAPRCPHTMDICTRQKPIHKACGNNHLVSCFWADREVEVG